MPTEPAPPLPSPWRPLLGTHEGVGMSLRLGFPVLSADLLTQKPHFCRSCGIDLLSNPSALLTSLTAGTRRAPRARAKCDCGTSTTFPRSWFA
jgi:hypothetical protein